MIVLPKIRGFICTTAHPVGCAANVNQQIAYAKQHALKTSGPKNVLVIGASTGYGLASRIEAAFGAGAKTIGVSYERAAADKRTATAGWYNTAAFEQAAHQAGLYAKSINGDAFSDEIKQQTIELIKKDWGGKVDLIIYSLASPRRTDPKTGEIYSSVLKPIGKAYRNKTINVMSGEMSEITLEPANEKDIHDTIKVMGGEDWQLWLEALINADLLAKGVKTIAYSYIGPELTFDIYRNGTIGKAKDDLEKTAQELDRQLHAQFQGHAYISVNKGLVTQSSAAIPVVPLYISLLYKIMKEKNLHEGCIEQIVRLFNERLYRADHQVPVDSSGRIRIDDWEMRADVQSEIEKNWRQVDQNNLTQISDLNGYRQEFHQLFGFEMKGVDYSEDVDVEVAIPSLASEAAV